MATYAVIEDVKVVNLIVVEDRSYITAHKVAFPDQTLVPTQGMSVHVGWGYDAAARKFVVPADPTG